MQFFSLYDLLFHRAAELKQSPDDVFAFFKLRKITKKKLNALQNTPFIPDDKVLMDAVQEFLGMNMLEIRLAMGNVPPEYRQSYFSHIKEIASMLKETEQPEQTPIQPFFTNDMGMLYNEDCIKVMQQMEPDSVDLIFADPPFNLGKEYDPVFKDEVSMSEYLNWTYHWLDECIRILKPGGRIFVYNLPKWCVYIAEYLQRSLTFWSWIAVDMKMSLPIHNRLYPAHYALVSFIKGDKGTFHNQRIPLQTCRHCGGEIKDYGGYKGKMNPQGVNVSDVWADIYPVRHKNTKNRKYNELSVKLLDRIISMASDEGDIVFDPFGGSGTTFAVAQLLGRRWVGSEIGDCTVIQNRLENQAQDIEQLKRVKEESGVLFTKKALELRRNNGFWVTECEAPDFKVGAIDQISLTEQDNNL